MQQSLTLSQYVVFCQVKVLLQGVDAERTVDIHMHPLQSLLYKVVPHS